MHYYQFNIADYRKDTQHLTPIEHYIYRELLDWVYLDEKPIPLDIDKIIRKLRLSNDRSTTVQNVTNVLSDFFTEREDGYIQNRAFFEINEYNKKLKSASKAGKASGKARRGKALERPLNDRSNTLNQPITNNHKPITNNQLKDIVVSNDTTGKTCGEVSPKLDKIPYKKIVDLWNDFAEENKLPKVVKVTEALKSQIRQRYTEDLPKLNNWSNYFDFIADSDFLSGRAHPINGRPVFRATLAWITKAGNFAKIAAREYHRD